MPTCRFSARSGKKNDAAGAAGASNAVQPPHGSAAATSTTTYSSASLIAPTLKPHELPGVKRLLQRYQHIPVERTRVFCIIAHIDHGKSTLADRLLEFTGNIAAADVRAGQVLDTLEVERERGITVKAQTASLIYRYTKAKCRSQALLDTPPPAAAATAAAAAAAVAESDVPAALSEPVEGEEYLLHLIDTPGHVDFSFEVRRSIAACDGALLLVDASQGVQAQTVAHFTAATAAGLSIIPVLTKIDLPVADPERALSSLEAACGVPQDVPLWSSAKTGDGIDEIFR